MHTWIKEFQGSVTVCDPSGIVLEMNDKAALTFASDGGYDLIGKNLLDCHPAPARAHLLDMMAHRQVNVYTIEKNGKKKFIYQTPWYENGEYRGFVELSMEIPLDMPHFVRG